jgi:hypothetical protein
MRALHDLSTERYRHDVISGNLADYITKGGYYGEVKFVTSNLMTFVEYNKARNYLGAVSDEWAGNLYGMRATPSWDIFSGIVGDLPMVSFCTT